MQGVQQATVDAIKKAELDRAETTPAERALLAFAEKLTRSSHRVQAADIDALRQHGWRDDQIAEAVYVIGMFAMFNRVADAFGLEDPGYANESGTQSATRPAAQFE